MPALKGSIDKGKHFIQFGNTIEQTNINDKLKEWEYQDSAGYSLPYNPANLTLFKLSTQLPIYLYKNIVGIYRIIFTWR